VSWEDDKHINMDSTMHSANMTEVTEKFGRRKMKPEYNTVMHGVNNADQYLVLYPFMRKTVK
jgi:hypothetical protein